MESDKTPLWARELRAFTEFSLGQLESRLTKTFDLRLDDVEHRIGARMDAFESRVERKIDNMDQRIAERFERLESKIQT
jgi:hypothetical protein